MVDFQASYPQSVHLLGTAKSDISPIQGTGYPQIGDMMGIGGAGGADVTSGHMDRCWDFMRLVRSVTWLNRLRRSAMSCRILRSACMTVV